MVYLIFKLLNFEICIFKSKDLIGNITVIFKISHRNILNSTIKRKALRVTHMKID